jgi:DNA replication protein DnaC
MEQISRAKKIVLERRREALDKHAVFMQKLRENDVFRRAEAALSEAKWAYAAAEAQDGEAAAALDAAQRAFDAVLASLALAPDAATPKFSCPLCEDTGRAEGGACACVTDLARRLLLEENPLVGRARLLSDVDFSYYGEASEAYRKLSAGIESRFVSGERSALVLLGATGTGKTYLASCAAFTLAERGLSVYSAAAGELARLFLKYTAAPLEAKSTVWTPLERDVVLLDDLGSEPVYNNVTGPLLYTLIAERLGKKTVITTNLSPADLEAKYGQRICSRLFDKKNSIVVQLEGRDLRL